jgi:ER-derived vesicles protein
MFLIFNVFTMLLCSTLTVANKATDLAISGLFSVLISQAIGYGLLFDSVFLLRTISVCGGLLMLYAQSLSKRRTTPSTSLLALINMTPKEMSSYVALLARILLVALFLGFLAAGESSLARIFVSLVGFVGCVMVVIGFKAKYSAWMLITFLCVSNVLLNNWWALHQ